MIAALNYLDLQSVDIENAYLKDPCQKKIWTRSGPKFGQDEVKVFIILMEFYGLKSNGALSRAFLAERLDEMGFKSSIADPYVWIGPATKADGEQNYDFILVYIDDLLVIIQYAVSVIREAAEKFKLKKDKIEPPEIYLRGRLARKELNGNQVWKMSSVEYVKAVVKNIE